ncbi:hypothetical protein [Methylobacter marinus]|uniref:hypothetical protein n=1 Tax=Methylobacter marinus TaxID=34058 RepID=UPI00036E1680|nr:hypothetical protein [Methylobacter marinus]
MKIQELADELIKYRTCADIVAAAKVAQAPTATKSDAKSALEALATHLEHNQHQKAVAITLALLLWDADSTVARIRRQGLFRASRYKFRSGALSKAVDASLQLLPQLQLREDRAKYLHSVQALLAAAPEAYRLRGKMLSRLQARKKIVLKTLLVIVNELFVQNWVGYQDESSENLEHWSAEELSQAFSYLLHLIREEFGIVPEMWMHVDEQLARPFESTYAGLLIDAARLNELFEVETLIDGLPYEIVLDGTTLKVFSTDNMLEKSIRLGYIQSEIQVTIRAQEVLKLYQEDGRDLPTMENCIAYAFQAGMGELFLLKTDPIERLVFLMPNESEFFALITTDGFFAEELIGLMGIGIENFQLDNAHSLLVAPNLTVLDILKVQRLFSFISEAFNEKLRSIQDIQCQRKLRMRSVLPAIRHDQLIQILEYILPRDKAEEAVRLITLEQDQKFIDVQYRPLIKIGSHYVIAPGLIARANLVRNIAISNNLRVTLVGEVDPMQEAVVKALTDAGFKVRQQFTYNINGKRETDILCWRDEVLFVFECKNSFHPCSSHEIRTSFEHIKTANEQLDIRLAWLRVPNNQAQLFAWLGWDVQITDKVHTGIITANRVFTGYRIGDHPVRQAHELINVLLRGEIRRSGASTLRFWRSNEFHAADLTDYLQGETIVRMQLEQLQPFIRRIRIGRVTIALQNYIMDLRAIHRDAEAAYAEIPLNAEKEGDQPGPTKPEPNTLQ